MPIHRQPVESLRNALALIISLAAIALFATVALAGAPPRVPAQANLAGGGTPSPTPTSCIQVWNVVESPNVYQNNELNSVDAVSSTDVWAVGTGMIDHWDGTSWTVFTGTGALTSTAGLLGVSAVSANDVWAVGIRSGAPGTGAILHWDGTNWSSYANPDPTDDTGLLDVQAISANDVWAVGYQHSLSDNALAIHWDGSTWTIVPTPAPPSGDAYELFDVSAITTNDVWAVGWSNSSTLILHWDGTSWSVSLETFPGRLFGVAAISPSDVWASGYTANGNTPDGFILHWDGSSWSLAATRNGDRINRMAFTSANDVWAVGGQGTGTLVMHWDGSTWSNVNSPRPFPFTGELVGVVALSPTEAWAVGYAGDFGSETSLTIHYTRWCPTPVPCQTGWNVIDAPNPSPDVNFINGIDGVSGNDIWAVGAFALQNGGTYALHWDGTAWYPVSIPGVPEVTVLRGVKAIASNNVWAVGIADDSTRDERGYSQILPAGHNLNRPADAPDSLYHTMIMHWDGTSWTRIPSPNPGTLSEGNELFSISGISASDLWAVGYYQDNTGYESLILHWNGSSWSQVTSPAGLLSGVDAISSNDVWAVGENSASAATVVLHWDGSQWSTVASPNPGTDENYLQAVSAVSANDIWAVGRYSDWGRAPNALTIHWDGSQWNVVSAPGMTELDGVSARASNDVWAVGNFSGSVQATIMHWDGSSWTVVSHPMSGPNPDDISELNGVLAVSSNEVWAVGDMGHYYLQARVERYVGSCATPSPTVTQTPIVTPSATPSPVPTNCVRAWTIVDSPNPGDSNELTGLAAISPNDMWAVGDTGTTHEYPLMEHWNGGLWSVITSTDILTGSSLFDVVAISSDNIWAVGTTVTNGSPRALTVHWDGNQWHSVPNPGQAVNSGLSGVSAVSANDIWAVGSPGVMHWDGSAWTLTQIGGVVFLDKVAAVSTNDVWAAGETNTGVVMVQWNGSQWSIAPGSFQGYTYGMTAISTNDIWAVNTYYDNTSWRDWILHWDGTSWTISSHDEGERLFGVTATATNDVWAVGDSGVSGSGPFAKHWDGTSWTIVPTSDLPADGHLFDAVATSPAELWAVGRQNNDNDTLAARYAYICPTPTIVPTNTPSHIPSATVTSTATPTGIPSSIETHTPPPASTGTSVATATATMVTGATNTPISSATASPTTCTLRFEDVPAGSTFYAGVRCLACRGIINGYPCGGAFEPCNSNNDPYFRPNNSVTRGQLAKIVSLAVGFFDPVSGQTFEDVLPATTFYTYVERLASRNVMSGYPCGGPNEPCDGQHRPYFRPNNTATRGQLTKIVSNAAGFDNIVPDGQQTFTDVPAGSTYYLYIERLLMNRPGVMSGYPCGGPNEPCDGQHRPYFRSSNTVTRGQTAKITANTFLPDCAP
jgi:hypothetical protein